MNLEYLIGGILSALLTSTSSTLLNLALDRQFGSQPRGDQKLREQTLR